MCANLNQGQTRAAPGKMRTLQSRQTTARSRCGEAWQNEADDGHRQQHHKVDIGAGEVKHLQPVPQHPNQQAEANQAVHDNHQHGKHRVTCQCRVVVPGQHNSGDQSQLDANHRQVQDQRAIRLANDDGLILGVVRHADNRGQHPPQYRPATARTCRSSWRLA